GVDLDVGLAVSVMAVIRWSRLHRGGVAGCEGSRSRSVGPARITRQRRQSGWIGRERRKVVIGCGRLRRGVFAGLGPRRIVGCLAATAVVRDMPGCLYGVVPRRVDRVSIRSVRYDGRTDRIRTIELQRG